MDSTDQQDTNIGALALDSRGKFRHVVDRRRQPSMGTVYLTRCNKRVSVVLKLGEFRHVPPCWKCVPEDSQ
jgi:hypothetical protein